MPHAFTAYLGSRHLDTALVADNSLVAYFLILAAIALKILGWAKDSLAEKRVPFRLKCAVIDGLWLGYFAI